MYNIVLISAVQQSDSVIYIVFHYGLSQNIEYSSLCYAVGLCCLSPKVNFFWLVKLIVQG